MKASIKNLKRCKRSLDVKLSCEELRSSFEEAYTNIKNSVHIPGFRTGKAPRDLLELHYGEKVKDEVTKTLIFETYKAVIEENKLEPIGYPEITDVKLDLKEGFSYKASIEIMPEFSLKNYKGLKLKKKNKEVNDEDIQRSLESLRERNAQNVPKEDSEEKVKVLPNLDDEFAKDLGFENMDKLKDVVRQEIRKKVEDASQADLERQVIDQLVESVDFDLPESVLNSEKERILKEIDFKMYVDGPEKKQDGDGSGKDPVLSEEYRMKLDKKAHKQAVYNIKAFFILAKIARMEKISLKQEEIDKHIEKMAFYSKKTKAEIMRYLEKNHALDEILVSMRNVKVMDFLLEKANIY